MERKIVWAIDPYAKNNEALIRLCSSVIQSITQKSGVTLYPVYVLTRETENILASAMASEWLESFHHAAQTGLSQQLSKLKISGLQPPQVLGSEIGSPSTSVDTLIQFAKKTQAELIVVGTHGKKGLKRLLIGSFAETLLLRSPIPVLTMNPGAEKSTRIKNILFPTDFSETSFQAFQRAIHLAQTAQAKVILYSKVIYPLASTLGRNTLKAGQPYKGIEDFFLSQKERSQEESKPWVEFGQKKGVTVKVEIDSQPGVLVESILKRSKKSDISLIAMSTETTFVSNLIMGSVSRQIVRNSSKPVWVLYEEEKSSKSPRESAVDPTLIV